MKFKYLILVTTLIAAGTSTTYPLATAKKTMVKIDDLNTAITHIATSILSTYGIEAKNLPHKTSVDLQSKITFVTNQMTNHLRMQKKTDVDLNTLRQDTEVALEDFIATALTVVSKKILPQAVNAFITKLAQDKPVAIEKLPKKMKDELDQRKALVLTTLLNDMKADKRDYVYVSELEKLCHNKFDLFFERAKYILISLWGQGAMTTLDSLKLVTNTQPFPVQAQK